jgi:hypothetical protein
MALNKDSQDRLNAIKEEEKLQRNLQKILTERITNSRDLTNSQKKLSETLLKTNKLEDKLLEVQKKKDYVFKKYVGSNKDLGKKLIEQLEKMEEILKVEKKRKDEAKKIQELAEEIKKSRAEEVKSLLQSVGLSSDMFKNGIKFSIGMMVAKKGAEMVSSAFNATVGLAKDLYTQTGATAAESARLGAQTMGAMFSMEGLLYGGEALAAAAKDASEYYGSTQVVTGEMQKNITALTGMMGDGAGAAQMNALLEQAGGNAGELTDDIKNIAQESGVNASELFKEMGKNANLLVGKSKEEIKILAKKTAELKKQGMSMDLMNSVSENMLDIESSLKAEMKARAFGMDINTSAIREAAVAMKYNHGTAADLAAAIQDQVGSAEDFGNMAPGMQDIYAKSVGMTTQELTDMLVKQEALSHQTEMYGENGAAAIAKVTAAASSIGSGFAASMPLLAQTTGFMKNIGIDAGAALGPVKKLAMAGLSKLGMGGMFGKGGAAGDAEPAKPKRGRPPGPSKDKGTGGLMESFNKMDMKKVIQGAAAMVIVAAAVFVFGKAVQEFMKVSWEAVGMAVVSMLALVGAVALLGTFMTGPVGLGVLVGAAAMLIIAAALFVLGKAIQEIAIGFGMMGELTTQLTGLVSIAPGLMALAGIFGILGIGLMGLGVGLALVTVFLPTLLLLAATLPLISSALGMGGGESGGSAGGGGGNTGDPLLEEIKGLRSDIQSQPIVIKVNDKMVTEMNRANSRMESVRRQHR